MSRRIVINSWGSYGDVFPYIGLAVELKARGHTPVVATARIYREPVERAGIEYAHVGPDLDAADTTIYERVMHPTRGGEVIIRELLLPKLAGHEQLRSVAQGRPARHASDTCARPFLEDTRAAVGIHGARADAVLLRHGPVRVPAGAFVRARAQAQGGRRA
jgi:hypothetical protein